jgi:heme/copper-type cytochrome/quinol oxidase subunit 3
VEAVTPVNDSISSARPLVPNGALGMALFIATEAMFFTGLISAFLVLRAQAPEWPPSDQPRLPVLVTGINTAVLLLSGWTMHRALAALRTGSAGISGWLGATAVLGAIFLGVQGFVWARLLAFGLTTTSSLYGATFYVLVGAHGLHVAGALVALFFVWRSASIGESLLLPMWMYWLFVVAVWPLLYGLVYF